MIYKLTGRNKSSPLLMNGGFQDVLMGRNSALKVAHMAGSHKKNLNQGPVHSGELLLNHIPRMSHRSNLANFTWVLGDRSICFEEQGIFF